MALFLGSYMKRKFKSLRPAAESHGNLCLRLLYGCCFSVKLAKAGSDEYSGQMASDGVPRRSTINSNCPNSDLPGNNGRCPEIKTVLISGR